MRTTARARRPRRRPRAVATRALAGVTAVAVSRDGRAVYASGTYFATFRRDPATGALEPVACLESYPNYKACQQHDKGQLGAVATTADGRNLYATSDAGIAVLGASGRRAQPHGTAEPQRADRGPPRLPGGPHTQLPRTGRRVALPSGTRRDGAGPGQADPPPASARPQAGPCGARNLRARDADRVVRATGRRVLVSAR